MLHFLRELTCETDWRSSPTPACLLIDDPNLHGQRYGYLAFHHLAIQARELGFYAAVATVPLDCWWTNRRVVQLFRENAPRLSLLPHGNNHTWEEMAHPGTEAENLALLAQALRRWQRLENLPGLETCRLMESPHGSLSVKMLAPMARLGYEAAFASTVHLLRCNPGVAFPPSLGFDHTLLQQDCVPVIPRIRAEPGWQTEVRLAAYLHQPIVLAAHHWDFADGVGLPEEFAGIVNSLPQVRWASPTGVARACYQFVWEDEVFHLKLGSRLVHAGLPEGTRHLMIHRPWLRNLQTPEMLTVHAHGVEVLRIESAADVVGPLALNGVSDLGVTSSVLSRVDCWAVPSPRPRCWPFARKLLVEARDRTRLRIRSPRVWCGSRRLLAGLGYPGNGPGSPGAPP